MTFKRFLSLYALYGRMDLEWLLRDTRFALLAVLSDVLSTLASISGIWLLAWRFGGLGGMNAHEVMLMLGHVVLVTGLLNLFCSYNTGHISRRIGRGQFDHMIIQPLPFHAQLMTEGFIPFTGSQNFLLGIVVSGLAIKLMALSPGLWWYAWFAFSVLLSAAILIGLSYLFGALAFWRPVAFEEISTTVMDETTGVLSKYPLAILPVPLRMMLISILPAGLIGWFPVCALMGKAPFALSSLYPLCVAALIWAAALLVFRRGLSHYVRIGSNRYKATGHRG